LSVATCSTSGTPEPDRYAGQASSSSRRRSTCTWWPFVEDEHSGVPEDYHPERKATKQYLGEESDHEDDADEKELLESVERGEWKSAGGRKRERARFSRYAKATSRRTDG